jgi:hypothetical protein
MENDNLNKKVNVNIFIIRRQGILILLRIPEKNRNFNRNWIRCQIN